MPMTICGPDGKPLPDQEKAHAEMAEESRKFWKKEHDQNGLETFEDVVTLLDFLNEVEVEDSELSWRVNDDKTSIVFMIDSSDLFAWGYADRDPITVADIPEMRRSYKDLEAVGEYSYVYWFMLFLSRKCNMRIQYPQYQRMPDVAKPLFKSVSDKPGYAWPKEEV